MNKLKKIFGVFLGATMLLGIGVLSYKVHTTNDAKQVDAATAGDTLSFYCDINSSTSFDRDNDSLVIQAWNNSADVQTQGSWISPHIFEVKNVETTNWTGFKFMKNGSTEFSSWNTNFNNRYFTCGGSVGSGTWSNKTPTSFSVTLSMTFNNTVPEYVDLYIPGAFNDWNTSAKMTRVSNTVFTYNTTVYPDSYEYKIIAEYAPSTQGSWDHQIDTSNVKVTFTSSDSGTTKSITDISNKAYNFTTGMPAYSPTLEVSFTSAVPDYADIYILGDFNGWSTDVSVSKMTRYNSTTFRYNLTNAVPKSYEYKIVACYVGVASVNWQHEIDTGNNRSITISSSNATSLGSRTYNFATNMPQQHAADGAHVTLTFAAAVPTSVDIIYVGSLTDWCTTAETMNAGKMTRTSATVYTWNIPSDTYAGEYDYKIVAMSKYTKVTSVVYTDIVYGIADTNEKLIVDSTTVNYALNANDYDLTSLGVYAFSEGFVGAMATPCADEDADNETAVSAIWGTWKGNFESLTTGVKNAFASSSEETVTQARTLYVHCVGRYGLATWTGAPSASARVQLSVFSSESNNALTIITIIASIGVLTTGAYMFFKKGKKVEQ